MEASYRTSFFQGTLDEIRLYDRALTDAEVNYLYFQATNDSDSDGETKESEDKSCDMEHDDCAGNYDEEWNREYLKPNAALFYYCNWFELHNVYQSLDNPIFFHRADCYSLTSKHMLHTCKKKGSRYEIKMQYSKNNAPFLTFLPLCKRLRRRTVRRGCCAKAAYYNNRVFAE